MKADDLKRPREILWLLFLILLTAGCAGTNGTYYQQKGKVDNDIENAVASASKVDLKNADATSGTKEFPDQFNKAMLAVYHAKTREDLEKAADEFLAARALNPSNPQVHYNLGLICLELEEFARAVNCFEDYLALSPDQEQSALASGHLARARGLQRWLESAKKAMVDRQAWQFLEHRPAELDSSWFPTEFRLGKDGRLQIKNPRLNYSPLDKERETRQNPWLNLDFKGRRFQFIVCLARERACNAGQGFCLIQGELVLDNGRTLVIARNYSYDVYTQTPRGGANGLVAYELQTGFRP